MDPEQKRLRKRFAGKEFVGICEKKHRRIVRIAIQDYSYKGGKKIGIGLIDTVVQIMQQYRVQNNIKFNANFQNPIIVDLDERVIATGGDKNVGHQRACFQALCRARADNDKLTVWVWFEGDFPKMFGEMYALDAEGKVESVWIPEGE